MVLMKRAIQIRFTQKLKHFYTNDLVRFCMLGVSCILVAAALTYFIENRGERHPS